MIWRISKSRPSTGSILPALALPVRSMVYWSRLGVLPPIGRGAPGTPARGRGGRRHGLFVRARDDAGEVLPQRLQLDLLPLLADVAQDARQVFVFAERQHGEAGADLPGVVLHRADQPGLAEHLDQRRAEGRRAGVARLELVEAPAQLGRQAGLIHAESFQDAGEIGIAGIQQLHEEVLDLDVVVGAARHKPAAPSSVLRVVSFSFSISDRNFRAINTSIEVKSQVQKSKVLTAARRAMLPPAPALTVAGRPQTRPVPSH